MSSASTQKSKRRRVVESDTMRQSQQQHLAQLQQSMARSQEQASNHLVRSAESQMRAAEAHAEMQQVHHSIQHLAANAAHLTSAQIQSGQFHIQGAPHAVRTMIVSDPPYTVDSRKHTLRSAPSAKPMHMSANTIHIAGAKAQQTHQKKREKELASKTIAHGRNISRLPGQIYPVTASQTSAAGHKEGKNMPIMHRQHQVGLEYGGTMSGMRSMLPQAPMVPPNPDVKLKRLPFYDVLGELMKPSSLIPKTNGRLQDTLFVFHLTPQQAQEITMSRDFRPGAKCEYTIQVQVRFGLLETTCEQADTFPSQIQVRVNNKPATLPNVIPTNKPNVEPKRPGRPVDITSLCRLSPTVSNAIQVSWAADFTRNFCMSIYLVKKLSSDILLQRLSKFGNRHSDHTKALIKEKLSQDPDSEIATTSLRVSLTCPLGKMRMTIPCRASTCTHLQCFDANTFLLMNERKPTWLCPVCDKQCPYDKLIIDGYFVDIFKSNPTTNDIIFHEDGSWTPMKPQKESSNQVILTSKSSSTAVQSPSTNSSFTATARTTSSSSAPTSVVETASTSTVTKPNKGPVIDLTLDSSEEDDDDAVIPSEPVNSPPFINLDVPSPAPLSALPGSPPVVLSSSSQSSSPTAGASHSSSKSATSFPTLNLSARNGAKHSPQTVHGSPPPLTSSERLANASPASRNANQSPSSALQSQALNLEAMSDADFDEFLKGLSWGV